MAYGEIAFTLPNVSHCVGQGPDYELQVTQCVWQQVFQEMQLVECGLCYCPQIDRGIVRGFNPDLHFVLKSTLHDTPCCDLVFKEADLYPVEPPADGRRGWDYHCGPYYHGYSHFARLVFADGAELVQEVNEQFTQAFGQAALQRILDYQQTDFEAID